jgi:hypothetical protein
LTTGDDDGDDGAADEDNRPPDPGFRGSVETMTSTRRTRI